METSTKDAFVSSLFKPKLANIAPKIQDVDAVVDEVDVNITSKSEEKSLLDLMIEEQNLAKAEKEKLRVETAKKTTKEIGGGFKKGFFGSSGPKPAKLEKVPVEITNKGKDDGVVNISKPAANANNLTKAKDNSLIINEVQQALKEDENPLLNQLKQGGIVTMLAYLYIPIVYCL